MSAMATVSPTRHVVPVRRGKHSASITPPWFVDKSEYTPKLSSYKILVNGQEAFAEVYQAIKNAKNSICIICWGFQPSMYFVRDGQSLMIGKLLEKKAREGVRVRVLCWAFQANDHVVVNVTGIPQGLNESNTPGRWSLGIWDKPETSSDDQYEYDKHFYRVYDRKQSIAGELRRRNVISDDYPKEQLLFTSRSYSSDDRKALDHIEFADKGLAAKTKSTLSGYPSHHQKMVVVDAENAAAAVGFVMGHNMLDEYWDNSDHSCVRKAADKGRNGSAPRHDYSSKVTGPIVGDLFRNFAAAWQKETAESLAMPPFETHHMLGNDPKAVCQILRTQPQYGRADIKTCYLQATANASQYIHIENQYFRWPPLAEKIKNSAAKMAAWGRTPERDGSLYLFVITNSSDAGMGDGTINTYRMLDSLGRADRLPEVARDQRLVDVNKQLGDTQTAAGPLRSERAMWEQQAALMHGGGSAREAEKIAAIDEKLRPLEAQEKQLNDARARLEPLSLRERTFGSDRTPEAIKQSNVPGLKVHVATLVAPDTPAGQTWQEVYIHAKLMLIDDAFMTAGSANINTRSMQTDSEMNIAHHRPEITAPLRGRQWEKYTAGRVSLGMSLKDAYKEWQKLMEGNLTAKKLSLRPLAQLAEFLRTSDKISNRD